MGATGRSIGAYQSTGISIGAYQSGEIQGPVTFNDWFTMMLGAIL